MHNLVKKLESGLRAEKYPRVVTVRAYINGDPNPLSELTPTSSLLVRNLPKALKRREEIPSLQDPRPKLAPEGGLLYF